MNIPLFKAKRIDNGEWVEGDLIHYSEFDVYILEQDDHNWDVPEYGDLIDPTTVGQATLVKDEAGKVIFEGDIVDTVYMSERLTLAVMRDEVGNLLACDHAEPLDCYDLNDFVYTIIGNIHDNPELLEK